MFVASLPLSSYAKCKCDSVSEGVLTSVKQSAYLKLDGKFAFRWQVTKTKLSSWSVSLLSWVGGCRTVNRCTVFIVLKQFYPTQITVF